MSRKKKKSTFAKLPHIVVSLFVLAIFAFPLIATARWVDGVIFGNDPRTVHKLEATHARPVDATDKQLTPFKEPIVTITFDDGWETAYSDGLPVMQKYGIRSTQYVLGDEFDNIAYLSEAQIRDMQKHGHEIASHSMTHPNLTTLDDEDLHWEVDNSKAILEKRLKMPIIDFASPLGAQDDRTIAAIKAQYRSQRNVASDPKTIGDEDINVVENFDRYNIIAYTVRASTTLADIQTLLDYAKTRNGWVILTYHQIEDSNSYYGITRQEFDDQMRLVSGDAMRSATMGQVLDAIQQQGVAKW